MRRLFLFAPILLSACGGTGNESTPAGNGVENAVEDIAPANDTTNASAPAVSLAGYAGKYPPDLVDGVPFLKNPAVVAAVDATLKAGAVDGGVRSWIFEKAGPQTPITEKDGKLLSFACETHNCGAHNWTVAITPDGAAADICYYDEAKSDKATWWLAGGKSEERAGGCPSGDEA